MTTTEVVRWMVAYFRAFIPSDDPPRGHGDLYLDLALSQKGVCRHRAFAFLVTALGMGIPARMVMNEAHAWVEVQGERLWQRIDLGGAAGDIDASDDGRPAHTPPSDPFEWPPSAEASAGRETVMRSNQRAAQSPGTGAGRSRSPAGSPGAAEPAGAASGGAEHAPPAPPGSGSTTTRAPTAEPEDAPQDSADPRPSARVVVRAADAETRRGEPLRVRGLVEADGIECSHMRVDVSLAEPGSTTKLPVGSLTTDAKGEFEGALFLPLTFPVGDYDVVVTTPGDARCGRGRN